MSRFTTAIPHQILHLAGKEYTATECLQGLSLGSDEHSVQLSHFLTEWFGPQPTMTVQTSGSTGTPKLLTVEKKRMIQSAIATCTYFDLQRGDRVLLPLPTAYISGMMMVVRALVAGLELHTVRPSSHPLATVTGVSGYAFIPMTPMQLSYTLQDKREQALLSRSQIILVGGGVVSAALETSVHDLPCAIYSSYGMTETLSHIALRRINGTGRSPHYTPLPGVQLSLSEEETLVIDAPLITPERLVTNDLAELYPDGTFAIVGRRDNVVNSGGVKIHLEEVEERLQSHLSAPFALTAQPDDRLGERLVMLLVENEHESIHSAHTKIRALLPSIQSPKEIYPVPHIPMTETHKINRKGCRDIALSLLPS